MPEEDKPTEKLEVRFPKTVLFAIQFVLTAERLADAAQAVMKDWDDPVAFTRLRTALTAYDEAKVAAIGRPESAPEPKT